MQHGSAEPYNNAGLLAFVSWSCKLNLKDWRAEREREEPAVMTRHMLIVLFYCCIAWQNIYIYSSPSVFKHSLCLCILISDRHQPGPATSKLILEAFSYDNIFLKTMFLKPTAEVTVGYFSAGPRAWHHSMLRACGWTQVKSCVSRLHFNSNGRFMIQELKKI